MKTMLNPVRPLAALSAVIFPAICFLAAPTATAAPFEWTGASGADDLWATVGNWNPSGPPLAADSAVFGDADTVGDSTTVNNIVGTSATLAALSYTNSIAATWHVTQIPAGNTLTVNGTVTVGGGNAVGLSTSTAMTGGGRFVATGNTFTVGNTAGSGTATPGTLDLSGLDNFVYSASAGTIALGTLGSRSVGNISLAVVSNSITAGTINMQGATGTGSSPIFNLGSGTNNINAGTINIGGGRSTTTFQFGSGAGGLRLRGTGGTDTDRTTMLVGDRNTGGTATKVTTGNIFLNGHPVDLKLATLTLGRMSRGASGTDNGGYNGVGVFEFDQGFVDVTTISMGLCSGNSSNSLATGTLTVGPDGTLLVVNVSLVNISSVATDVSGSGTLNVSGGEVTCAGNITKTTATGAGTITVNTGSLTVQGRIGSVAIPVDNLELTDATLTLAASATGTNVVVTNLTTGGLTNIINVTSVPGISGYPAQFPLIAYAGAIGGAGFDNNVGLGSLPAGTPSFEGYLSNNIANLTIDLVITNGPPPAQPLTWTGLIDGAWETTRFNWRAGLVPTNYNNAGDFVTFGDITSTSTVHLVTAALTPGSITVSNQALTYTFTGSGKLSGSAGLTKQGAGTLILDNSGGNDFSGSISISGTLQVGTGGTSGTLPSSGNVANNGTLVFNRSDNFTQGNTISGAGAVTKNATNTLTLTGANSFGGGLTVNAGVIRLNSANSGGAGTITVNSAGTVVLGAAQTNSGIILVGGTLGTSLNLNPLVNDLTAAPGTTSLLYMADPQNLTPADGNETAFTGTWHGSGNVIVVTVPNDPSPDGGNGFRLRGTAVSDFSGSLALSNRVKGELQTSVAGPFSPAGTGKLVLACGVLASNSLNGTYSELNLRNNSTGDTVFGNDVELAGTGLAVLDPLGSAPAVSTITMGNLRMGGGQELGVNLNGAGPDHPVVFQSVTLTGGNATFSPKTIGWNSVATIGSDLSLSNISETAAVSSITMNGLRTLFIAGTNTYNGSTTVSNGTMHLSGTLNGRDGTVTVAGGTLMGNGSAIGVTVHPAGTISPGASVGKFTANRAVLQGTNVMEIDRTAGTNDVLEGRASLFYGGTLVISNLTDPLQAGDSFKLYNANVYSGSFSAIIPDTPGVDLVWNTSSLTMDGTLKVASTLVPGPFITSFAVVGTDLIVSGTNATAGGEYYVLTSTNIALPVTNWSPILTQSFNGMSFSFTNAINPADPQRFFLLQLP